MEKVRFLIITVLVLLPLHTAFANMAASDIKIRGVGSSIKTEQVLVLQKENLDVQCNHETGSCNIETTYDVVSEIDAEYLFTFVTPTPNSISVSLNGRIAETLVKTEPLSQSDLFIKFQEFADNFGVIHTIYETDEGKHFYFEGNGVWKDDDYVYYEYVEKDKSWQIYEREWNASSGNYDKTFISQPNKTPRDLKMAYEAGFRLALSKGKSRIVVRYRQPMARLRFPGYIFRSARNYSLFIYDLWPIDEWKKDPGFTVEVHFSLNKNFTFWERIFTGDDTIKCFDSNRKSLLEVGDIEFDGNVASFQLVFDKKIPKRLICEYELD